MQEKDWSEKWIYPILKRMIDEGNSTVKNKLQKEMAQKYTNIKKEDLASLKLNSYLDFLLEETIQKLLDS
jgi:hypothetical protein